MGGLYGELIQAAVNIKDPFTLFAFLAAVRLIAFRSKAVFLVSCGITVLGQILGYKTAARAASLEELKQEVALSHARERFWEKTGRGRLDWCTGGTNPSTSRLFAVL
jgi:hypothetical protein